MYASEKETKPLLQVRPVCVPPLTVQDHIFNATCKRAASPPLPVCATPLPLLSGVQDAQRHRRRSTDVRVVNGEGRVRTEQERNVRW